MHPILLQEYVARFVMHCVHIGAALGLCIHIQKICAKRTHGTLGGEGRCFGPKLFHVNLCTRKGGVFYSQDPLPNTLHNKTPVVKNHIGIIVRHLLCRRIPYQDTEHKYCVTPH